MHPTRMWQKTTKMAILFIIFALIVPNIPNPLTIVQIAKGDPGSTIYVATTGNDATGDGSFGNPYKTIQKAVNVSVAGDTIYVRGGNYNEYVRIKASGTAGHPITIKGYGDERAVIDGTGLTLPSTMGSLVMLFNSAGTISYDYITIENMHIENSTKVGLRSSFSVVNPSNNIIISNCSFYNIVYNALAIWEDDVVSHGHCENITVKNCIFNNIQTGMNTGECVTFVGCKNVLFQNNTLSQTHKTGADFATNSEDIIIDNNIFDTTDVQNWGSGLYLDGSQKSEGAHINNATISNNYFHGTKSGIKLCCEIGSTLSSLNNITIVNNIFNIDCATSLTDGALQICTNDGTSYWHAYDITIKYNTIYVSVGDWSADACIQSDLTPTYVHTWAIANNILISGAGTYPNYQMNFKFTKAESDLVRENNLYYKVGGTASCHFSDNAGNDCLEASAVDDNPDVVSLGTNFHLNATSPAIDAGSSAYITPYDFDDNPRPHGVGYDIGAYEYTGNSFYVATTGNDITGTGSIGNPYKTIQKACNVSGNGDTVYVMAGTYTPASQIIISNKNTANDWLTIRNYNNDYVEINGSNCPSGAESNVFDSVIELDSCKYVRITGLAINHSAQGGITLAATCSFVTVDNCSINNCSVFAIKSFAANNITFEHNYLYNNFNNWSATVVGQETISFEGVKTFSINNNTLIGNRHLNIDVKDGCKNGEICYNEINTTAGHVNIVGQNLWGGGAIYLDARGVSSNISIFNNNMYGNNTGIELNTETSGHFEYIYVYNNVINMTNETGCVPSSSGRGAIGIANTGLSTGIFHNIYIYSNTITQGTNNTYALIQIGHYSIEQFNASNLQDVYIYNNIFYTKDSATGTRFFVFYKILQANGHIILRNNSFYRPSGAISCVWGTGPPYSVYYSTSSPSKFGTAPLFTNPMFVDATHGNFHLNSTSPCIDTGNSTLVPSFDFDGNARPQGFGYDIGAYEYVTKKYYVSNSGKDSNDGMFPSTPWKTIGKVNTAMSDGTIKTGDNIYFKCGDNFTDATLNIKIGGTAADPMVIGDYGTGNRPIFYESGDDIIICTTKEVNYVTVQNLALKKGNEGISFSNNHTGIIVRNVTIDGNSLSAMYFNATVGLKIENCIITNSHLGGIELYGSHYHALSNVTIRNCSISGNYPYADAVEIHDGDNVPYYDVGSNFFIENVTVTKFGRCGFDCVTGHNITYKNCTISHCTEAGLTISPRTATKAGNITIVNFYCYNQTNATACGIVVENVNQVIIRNSIFYNVHYHDMLFGDGSACSNVSFFNNDLIFDGKSMDATMIDVKALSKNIRVKNNMILSLNTSVPTRFVRFLDGSTIVNSLSNWSSNLWYRGDNATSASAWNNGSSNRNWAQWTSQLQSYHELKRDPLLMDTSKCNWTLKSNSSCVDAGDWPTHTNGAGLGTQITVKNARYFTPGYWLTDGDIIVVGSTRNLKITNINYYTNQITVNRSFTWADNDPVSFPYAGSAPDIGAYEYVNGGGGMAENQTPVFSGVTPSNGSINVPISTSSINLTIKDPDGDNFNWMIQTSPNVGSNSGNGQTNGSKTCSVSGLAYSTTYTWYVNVTDGTDWTNVSYIFTTESQPQNNQGPGGGNPPPSTPPGSSNNPPVANASAGEPYIGFAGLPVGFNGSWSNDSDGNITKWFWDFGDEANGSGKIVTHTYSKAGTYTVTLTVTDNDNATDSDTSIVVIRVQNKAPSNPNIDGPTTGNKNVNYSYNVLSTDANNDTIKYTFDWGDGTTESSKFLPNGTSWIRNHSWTKAGKYTIKLTATDNQTDSSSEKTILIDAVDVGNIGYLTNDNNDSTYDLFHSNDGLVKTSVEKQTDGTYLIDSDGDGKWNYVFDITSGLKNYETKESTKKGIPGFELVIVVCAIALVLLWKRKNKV
jgi:PKD repeat protein/polygalacturonase